MTTQSPDQSLSQLVRDIEQKHTKCRGVHVTTHYKAAFRELADLVTNLATEVEGSLGAIERCHQCEGDGCAVCAELQSIPPLNAPITQSPAPSEEMEERINRIAREAGDWAERTYGKSGHLLHYITRQAARSALVALAAELGKEREAESRRWDERIGRRDGQTAKLIESLRAEIETLKRELAEENATLKRRLDEAIALLGRMDYEPESPVDHFLTRITEIDKL